MTMLTPLQKTIAQELRMIRPPVIPGTSAIHDPDKREAWYSIVLKMTSYANVGRDSVDLFFDACGVAK